MKYESAHIRVRTGRPVRLQVHLGVVELDSDVRPSELSKPWEYTLKSDDGSYTQTRVIEPSDDRAMQLLRFEGVPMDAVFTLEVCSDGNSPEVVFSDVPFRRLQV